MRMTISRKGKVLIHHSSAFYFQVRSSENFAADNVVYMEFSNLSIELYTDEKDPELEDRVEAVLNAHELFWNKSEVWIKSEKLYEVLYQMTV